MPVSFARGYKLSKTVESDLARSWPYSTLISLGMPNVQDMQTKSGVNLCMQLTDTDILLKPNVKLPSTEISQIRVRCNVYKSVQNLTTDKLLVYLMTLKLQRKTVQDNSGIGVI
jgi:hypothetical protein